MLVIVLFVVPCAAAGEITPINDLINASASKDKSEVTIQGEVIGEALERGEYTWVNVCDATNAIGVWVKKSEIKQIHTYGDYKHKGDIVKITGEFSRACPEHGGDVDIHSSSVMVIESGYSTKERISSGKIIITALLLSAAGIVSAAYLKVRKSSQKMQ